MGRTDQLESLSTLLQLEREARQADSVSALAFLMVNGSHALTPYRQACLWQADSHGSGRIIAFSGQENHDPDAPFPLWMNRLLTRLHQQHDVDFRPMTAQDLAADDATAWEEWLPPHALWIVLKSPEGHRLGGLFLARDHPWTAANEPLLSHLVESYGHAWNALTLRRKRLFTWPVDRFRAGRRILLFVAVVGTLMIPVHQSTLAPASVTAVEPTIVRSAMDGVVDEILVEPNQRVEVGTPLLRLDDRTLANRLAVTHRILEASRTELRQLEQTLLTHGSSHEPLIRLEGRIQQTLVERDHLRALLERIEIRAERSGVVIMDRQESWQGRPVVTGQRILMIADPSDTEISITLPLENAIPLPDAAPVTLHLSSDPSRSHAGRLRYRGFQPVVQPEGFAAYPLKARFVDHTSRPRLGLRGTVTIQGEKIPLFYYLFRRPVSAFRRLTGF
ncbi:MAG: HlyD family efflux transporter periplasmic adaptor subunit [Magnetococcales bacterium]|nr:HlyD family efflux transporter periplasmic adaptor subunit [Magnetococcales bacterium]